MSFIKEKVKEDRLTVPKSQSDEDKCDELEQNNSQNKQEMVCILYECLNDLSVRRRAVFLAFNFIAILIHFYYL